MWTCQGCREESEDVFEACWNCGTGRDGRPDPGFRRADEPDPPPVPVPVSAGCPACGRAEYRTTRPAGWLAYTQDRVCLGCGTRYTPPTPRWAAITFVALGGLIAAVAAVDLALRVLVVSIPGLAGVAGTVLFGALGVAAVRHGVRALRHPGRV